MKNPSFLSALLALVIASLFSPLPVAADSGDGVSVEEVAWDVTRVKIERVGDWAMNPGIDVTTVGTDPDDKVIIVRHSGPHPDVCVWEGYWVRDAWGKLREHDDRLLCRAGKSKVTLIYRDGHASQSH